MSATPTLVIRRDSRAIRAYSWLWEADPRQANFCKLFWAVVFAPVALFIFKPLGFVLRRKTAAKKLARIEGFAAAHPRVARLTSKTVGVLWASYMLIAVGWCLFWLLRWFSHDAIAAGVIVGGVLLSGLVLTWLLRFHLDALARFGTFLLTGYRAVKTRTCPRIELREPGE